MRRLMRDEAGMSIITVLGVLVFLLLILGTVIQLAPTQLRRAKFEADHAMALYAAESGINHALAAMNGEKLLDESEFKRDGDTYTFMSDGVGKDGTSGRYTVKIRKDHSVTSEGTYNGRTRTIQVELAPEVHEPPAGDGGRLFPQALVSLRSGLGYDQSLAYEVTQVQVPAWADTEWPAQAQNPCPTKHIRPADPNGHLVCEYPPASAGNGAIATIENSTVFIDGNLQMAEDFVISNSTVYVNGSMFLNSNGMLIGPNVFYVYGSLEGTQDKTIRTPGGNGDNVPWNYFFVRQSVNISGPLKLGSVGRPGPDVVPDVLIFTNTSIAIGNTAVSGDGMCACGIYSPTNQVAISAPQQIYGSVVGGHMQIISGHSGQLTEKNNGDWDTGPGNKPSDEAEFFIRYDAYRERMRNITFRECRPFLPHWQDCPTDDGSNGSTDPTGPGPARYSGWREL